MGSVEPPIVDPVGRSRVRGDIVSLLGAQPDTRYHLRAIARAVGTSPGTARRELLRLQNAGVVGSRSEGSQRYFWLSLGPGRPDPAGVRLARLMRSRLRAAYGTRLKGVYLYGSRARGDHDADSDVDILIVLDEVHGYARDLRLSGEVVSRLSLASGLQISRLLASERSWAARDRPFLAAIARDAIEV
jgi:predicted nucleotidyltransferase